MSLTWSMPNHHLHPYPAPFPKLLPSAYESGAYVTMSDLEPPFRSNIIIVIMWLVRQQVPYFQKVIGCTEKVWHYHTSLVHATSDSKPVKYDSRRKLKSFMCWCHTRSKLKTYIKRQMFAVQLCSSCVAFILTNYVTLQQRRFICRCILLIVEQLE